MLVIFQLNLLFRACCYNLDGTNGNHTPNDIYDTEKERGLLNTGARMFVYRQQVVEVK